MLSKNKIKFISGLKKKKFRNEYNLFLAEGTKLVKEIASSGFHIRVLCATQEWMNTYHHLLGKNIKELITITQEEIKKISSLKTPEQVLAVVKQPYYRLEEHELTQDLSLVLEQMNDPGNLGTLIRIADWFGIQNVICSPDTVEIYNQKVIQSTMGSICRVKIHYQDLPDLLTRLRKKENFPIYGTVMENGENIYQSHLTNRGLLIMGNESHGISEELKPYIGHYLSIPIFSTKPGQNPESLNVSVAAGIICSEFRRRQG